MNTVQTSKRCPVLGALGLVILAGFACVPFTSASTLQKPESPSVSEQTLTPKQLAIAPIGASMAVGDMPRLHDALNRGLDAGLTVSESKEILVQLYAYAGFPRSLNALSLLMKVLEERAARGIHDAPGRDPGPVPSGRALLDLGTDNQTRLLGAPVSGPLFEFAPAIDQFLKSHLFGDIFARDNLQWVDRELATVGALAAMSGVESQLESHLKISTNVGLTVQQLRQVAGELKAAGELDGAKRVLAGLEIISG